MPVMNVSLETNEVVAHNQFVTDDPKRAKLVSVDLDEPIEFVFPFGPMNISFSNVARESSQLKRPFDRPLLLILNQRLVQVNVKGTIAEKASHGTTPVVDLLNNLRRLCNGVVCRFVYGDTAVEQNMLITACQYVVQRRNTVGQPVQVSVDITLTEYPVYNQDVLELKAVTPAASSGAGSSPPPDVRPDATDGSTQTRGRFSLELANYYVGLARHVGAGAPSIPGVPSRGPRPPLDEGELIAAFGGS